MLIKISDIKDVLSKNDIKINGVFHIGANNCEEMSAYNELSIQKENVIWIDAIPEKVIECTEKGMPNVYNAIITDKDFEDVVFNISNNSLSSSVLEFGTHLIEHPHVHYVEKRNGKTITIDTFFKIINIDASNYDFWNFDIQGAELLALKGGTKSIPHAKAIYLEVNEKELYKNCGLIEEIDAFLAEYNFERVLTEMTPHGWGDALYIKTR
jgi:hypothetical protein